MAKEKNNRKIDHTIEQAVGTYLDSHLYNQPPFDSFKRIANKQLQKRGIDLILTSTSNRLTDICVDEKCSAHYVNKDIPTFAFEIGSYQNDSWVEGWLFNNDSLTEYYLLLWPKAKIDESEEEKTTPKFECQDIESIHYCLVPRQSIINYLSSFGFNKDKIQEVEQYYRKNKIFNHTDKHDKLRKYLKEKYGQNCKFYFVLTPPISDGIALDKNKGLEERPFNVLVFREKLEELAIVKGNC